MNAAHPSPAPCIVLFDGVCGLCNRWIAFLIRRDSKARFVFVPSQSEAGRELMRRHRITEEQVQRTLYTIEDDGVFTHSEGALRIAERLPFPWRLLSVSKLIPVPIRDGVYRIVAANRYRWFGKMAECPVPSPEQRRHFLQTREDLEAFEKAHPSLQPRPPE